MKYYPLLAVVLLLGSGWGWAAPANNITCTVSKNGGARYCKGPKGKVYFTGCTEDRPTATAKCKNEHGYFTVNWPAAPGTGSEPKVIAHNPAPDTDAATEGDAAVVAALKPDSDASKAWTKSENGKSQKFVLDGNAGATMKLKSSDPCATGEMLQGGGDQRALSCQGTRDFVTDVGVANQVLSAVDAGVVQNVGNQGAIQAQQQGTVSSAIQAGASSTKTAGELTMGTGVIGLIAGYMEKKRGDAQKANADYISNQMGSDGESSVQLAHVATKIETASANKFRKIGYKDYGDNTGSDLYVEAKVAGSLTNTAMTKFHAPGSSNLNDDLHYMKGDGSQDMNVANTDFGDAKSAAGIYNAECTTPGAAAAKPGSPFYVHCKSLGALAVNQQILRNSQANERVKDMQSAIGDIRDKAIAEQKDEATRTSDAAMLTMITAGKSIITGAAEMAAAKSMNAAAASLAGNGVAVPGANPYAPPIDNGTGQSPIVGQPSAAAASAASPTDKTAAPGGLGTGFNTTPQPNHPGNNPAPAPFAAAPPGGGTGGGSNGSGGGVGTAAATGDNTDPAAKSLSGQDPSRYEAGSYNSGGGKGGSGDKGTDLSGLLAQFLPKKEEDFSKNILDFGGGRGPASEDPISLLDRNTNIFERVHETYQDKSRRGNL